MRRKFVYIPTFSQKEYIFNVKFVIFSNKKIAKKKKKKKALILA